MAKEKRHPGRKRVMGLVVDRGVQFKLGLASSVLILLPSLVVTLVLVTKVSSEALDMATMGASGSAVAQYVYEKLGTYSQVFVAVFLTCSAIAVFYSLKVTHKIVGPVNRLEDQVEGMIKGNYERRVPLRKGDYLETLGALLNKLADKQRK